ncbi:MAG: cytochrome c nitrite reductase small subunit [Chloroflexota bacterium]
MRFAPEPRWRIPTVILAGTLAGLGAIVFYISNAASYLSDDPRACINCHIMTPQYATWLHSSHREKTVCNDCHVPHDNVFRKYLFKAQDGMRHAAIFTLRIEPQVIHIKDAGKGAVQENCIRCHGFVLTRVEQAKVSLNDWQKGKGKLCWECHREVPHGRIHSDASTPHARVPALEPISPRWMKRK